MSFSKASFPEGKPRPSSWADFWDVKKSPRQAHAAILRRARRRLAPCRSRPAGDGVPADKLYPLDMQRAVKKLKELSPNVIWWKNPSQPGQYLVTGEAVMVMNSVGRTNVLADQGAPVQYVL